MSLHNFLHNDFLLLAPQSQRLYHEVAATLPIIDYHCHLSPAEIADDRRFANLAQAWLAGDHYKWRAMRACGVDEAFITGTASDREKFDRWAWCVPQLLRNPLYHWTHLELKRYFGIDLLLSPDTADAVWDAAQGVISTPAFSARGLIRQMRVEFIGTTDDPADSLTDHARIAADATMTTRVAPTFRPDRAAAVANNYCDYLDRLSTAASLKISVIDDLLEALARRHQFFHNAGCRLSDHGFGLFRYVTAPRNEIAATFARLRRGETVSQNEANSLASLVLETVAALNHERGWVMQLHIGAMRNNNAPMFAALGPDSGYDSIQDGAYASDLAAFFSHLATKNSIPKTIVYNLNPSDNAMLATLVGNYQGGGVAGKMQFGSGWWFLDQRDGMIDQLNTLSQLGVLSLFVGMLTDSRSFLSYTRHEYFRRILCELLGQEMHDGLLPDDHNLVGTMVGNICYHNAKRYFGV